MSEKPGFYNNDCTHRHPDFWENPEGFDFGGGPRQCIGNEFAMLEARLVLAAIAQKYRLELVSGHPIEPEPMITLRPKHGILMRVRERV